MHVIQPRSIEEALRARCDDLEAVVVAGGTEVMPLRNRDERSVRLQRGGRVPILHGRDRRRDRLKLAAGR